MSNSKVALITGAGKRRLGAHVADALALRNYRLAIHYRTSAHEAQAAVERYQAAGRSAVAVAADLGREAEVAAMVEQVLNRFGRIDVLVNCAGDWRARPLEEVTAADV
ncbi:MAG: SDR family NAD(P)-dependent oxidoreductase, partial [Gemmataceae bacterium]|nr:SDR family NAD(P)-dependent oxidoreductase [Gemmataceae bacterium]